MFTKNSQTKILGLIGSPVAHSLSPKIHNTVYKLTKRDAVYIAFDIKNEELSNFISASRLLNIHGFNVTMPHKLSIVPFLVGLSDAVFSINTVKLTNNKLSGISTDGYGFLSLLTKNKIDITGKNILIIGSGGSAAVVFECAMELGASVKIASRNIEQAKVLTSQFYSEFIDFKNLSMAACNVDIVVNATPLGMFGYEYDFESFNFLTNLNKNAVVIDLIYNPLKTSLIKAAINLKIETYNGLDMLLGQAFQSHRFWFDEILDADIQFSVESKIKSLLL